MKVTYETPLKNKAVPYQANVFKYDPQQTNIKGYSVTKWKWTYSTILRSWIRPLIVIPTRVQLKLLWANMNVATNIAQQTSINQTLINSTKDLNFTEGQQYTWSKIYARWTADHEFLESTYFLPRTCLAFNGNQTTKLSMEKLRHYHGPDIRIDTKQQQKREYYATTDFTICQQAQGWLTFKRPTNHTLNPYRIVVLNTTIINETTSIRIPALSLSTWLRIQDKGVWITYSNNLISTINETTASLHKRIGTPLHFYVTSKVQQQIESDNLQNLQQLQVESRLTTKRLIQLTNQINQIGLHLGNYHHPTSTSSQPYWVTL